ncbi:NAD(P)/FAD-dependent oxidoreductase [Plantibacter sp. Mn2098]|uniref:NAD(P)/FAD-dependent oxidoreductase n=1 Tax=Plantibacter sp. Mn2098 TaxID=3395266 RepID=UPI003BE9D6B7
MNREQEAPRVWETAIIGGGSAGLSAALILARARRRVIVIDGGKPRNAPAAAAHGLLGHDGIDPLNLLEKGREEVSSYGAHVVHTTVVESSGSSDEGFVLHLVDGTSVRASQLLLASGVRDELPAIPGLAERWGRDVVHCPYCHGWEIRDQRIGLLATGPMSALEALLFQQWSTHVWFFPNGMEIPAEELQKLIAVGVTIVAGRIGSVEVTDDRLAGARLDNGTRVALDALAVPARTVARLDGLEGLGIRTVENVAGVAVVVDAAGRTSTPGVWAAGNVVNPGMQVSEAAANGARVAMTINTELVFARAYHALVDRRKLGVV